MRLSARAAAALLAGLLVMLAGPALAVTGPLTTYRDLSYGTTTSYPTADKPQSKLWYQDGAWWALLVQESDNKVHIAELRPDHTWRMTDTVVDERASSTGDALWDGRKLYVASRQASSALRVSRLSYDATARTYLVDPGFPGIVTSGGSESATLDKDSAGRLWVTFTRGKTVWVAHTTSDDSTWTPAFTPPVGGTTISSDDISALIAFNGKVGVMWSNQVTSEFTFAVHVDGAPDSDWTRETPLAGTGLADDHINLKNVADDASGRIYATVKTSLDADAGAPPDAPHVLVLVRDRQGGWTSAVAGTAADDHTRPMLLLDETNQMLYFFATAPVTDGVIYYKRTPLSAIAFEPGRGTPFVKYTGKYVNNATSTKQPVNAASGIVVLASSGSTDHFYYHAEMGIAPAADTQAPSTPTGVSANATSASSVALSWSPSTDDSGVTSYRVYRDGTLAATSRSTSYSDSGLQPDTTYRYAVAAVDAAGNSSAQSNAATVTTPPAPGGQPSAITFRGASSGANGTDTSVTVPQPAGTTAGDVLLASVDVRGRPALNAPAGWQLLRTDDNGTTMRKATYLRVATSSEPASYTWTLSSAQGATATVQAYSGVDPANPVESSSGQANAASRNPAAASVTVTAGNVIVALFGAANQVAVTPPSDMTERAEAQTVTGTYRVSGESSDVLRTTTGTTGVLTASLSGSTASIGQLVALRAAQ